jgi:uncharacterized protein (TIGR00369 family)
LEVNKTNSTFYEYIGFTRDETDQTQFSLELMIQPYLLQDGGSVHPGVFATMLDIVMGATISEKFRSYATTINLNMSFFELLPKEYYRAETAIINRDANYVTAEGVIFDKSKTLIAKGFGTFKIAPDSVRNLA